nr:hypothetical protein [Planctomycetota bacterium]
MIATRCSVSALLLLAAGANAADVAANMIGRQSQNEGLSVVPAPGAVAIDGDLADWDWSGRNWSFADTAIRDRYSVESAAMWDAKHIYFAAKWRDPTPMGNMVDATFAPNDGWKGDCWQIRVQADRISHLTSWHFTEQARATMHITHAPGGGGDPQFVVQASDGAELGRGIAMAFRKDADGKGYTQEVRVPWSVLYEKPPAIAAGLTIRIGCEFLWGDPSGKNWPTHRYADNMQPGVTSREFYWQNTESWGNATLLAAGKLTPRRYVAAGSRLPGS